jgi:hypothetical protein
LSQPSVRGAAAIRTYLRDERGGAPSIEMTLIAIPMIVIVLAVVQVIMLARATVVMEHAAYAAARSALVHACRPITPLAGGENLFSVAAGVWGGLSCDDTHTREQALRAAQLAVIPISASNGDSRARQGDCGHPEAAVDLIIGAGVRQGLREAVEAKACYAFEPENVDVEFAWTSTMIGVSSARGLPPLEATVTFRMPVFLPVRGVFSDGRRGDGTHYRTISATVNLL